jgi:hypothetical protein
MIPSESIEHFENMFPEFFGVSVEREIGVKIEESTIFIVVFLGEILPNIISIITFISKATNEETLSFVIEIVVSAFGLVILTESMVDALDQRRGDSRHAGLEW